MSVTVTLDDGTVVALAEGASIEQGGSAVKILDNAGATLGYWQNAASAVRDDAVVVTSPTQDPPVVSLSPGPTPVPLS